MYKLGLIGCGAIGGAIVDAFLSKSLPLFQLVGILEVAPNQQVVQAECDLNARFVREIEAMIELQPHLILEAASHQALMAYGPAVLEAGIHLLPMSIGALADPELRNTLSLLASRHDARLYIPSGAIGGLDVLRSARIQGGLYEVVLTSMKKPVAFKGNQYLSQQNIKLDNLRNVMTVFDGSAAQACLAFPKSTNISAAVSLAGLGFDHTRVRILADPNIPRTRHELWAKGAFGELNITLENYPHPANPSTTYLACLSAIAALNNYQSQVSFI